MRNAVVIVLFVTAFLTVAALAQESRSEISLQGTGFFTRGTTGNGTDYRSTESGGFLGTYRYHLNRWVSAEAAYGYDRNTQKYSFLSAEPFRLQSGIHQFTGSLVLNLPTRTHSRFNPYAIIGGGALLFDPTSNQVNTLAGAQTQAKGTFVYGAGLNYAIRKGIALRAEYRGLVYGTPDFGFGAFNTNAITHTAEPSIGITFRF